MNKWLILLVATAALWIMTAASGCVPAGDEIAYPGETVEGDDALHDDAAADPPGDEKSAVEGETEAEEIPDDGSDEGKTGEAPARAVSVKVYFSDTAAVGEGRPGETGYVKAITREFPHTPAVLRLALEELIRGPLPGEGDLGRTLPAAARITGLKIEDGTAFIDFSPELVTASDRPAGTAGGTVFIQSVVYTATQFPTVDAVLVTVNGEAWNDGHYVWDKPLSRADLQFE